MNPSCASNRYEFVSKSIFWAATFGICSVRTLSRRYDAKFDRAFPDAFVCSKQLCYSVQSGRRAFGMISDDLYARAYGAKRAQPDTNNWFCWIYWKSLRQRPGLRVRRICACTRVFETLSASTARGRGLTRSRVRGDITLICILFYCYARSNNSCRSFRVAWAYMCIYT